MFVFFLLVLPTISSIFFFYALYVGLIIAVILRRFSVRTWLVLKFVHHTHQITSSVKVNPTYRLILAKRVCKVREYRHFTQRRVITNWRLENKKNETDLVNSGTSFINYLNPRKGIQHIYK